MMGQLPGGQQRLFYSFNLEDHVPAQHLLRSIDQCLISVIYVPTWQISIAPSGVPRLTRS